MTEAFPDSDRIGGLMNKNRSAAENLIDRRAFLRNTTLLTLGAATGAYSRVGWSAENDVLHIRNYSDLKTLDPAMMFSGSEGLIGNTIYLSLVQFKPGDSWEWQLDAAEYFEQIDATHFAFRLRPGIFFSNGFGEMTAEDVKYSLERIIDPAMNSPNAGDMGTLSHVEVTGRYSGTIVLKSPFAAFVPIGLCAGTGSIVSKKAVESVGGSFEIEPPCCSGPYRFVS